jgi:hypothetical protein
MSVLMAILAVALAASVLSLAREMRLRKALEKLLRILLSRWRSHVHKIGTKNPDVDNPVNKPAKWL